MDFPAPDPVFTRSEQSRAHFRLSVKIALGFLALIWLIQLIGWALDMGPEQFGIRPRQLAGLPGILFAPLMHGGFAHLIANSPALLVSGTAMLFLYPHSALRALPAIYFGSGFIVWLAGRDSVHLGASGLVYGLVSHIFVAGLLRRDRRAIAASLFVAFMYGSLAWGVFPAPLGVSWETHLCRRSSATSGRKKNKSRMKEEVMRETRLRPPKGAGPIRPERLQCSFLPFES